MHEQLMEKVMNLKMSNEGYMGRFRVRKGIEEMI